MEGILQFLVSYQSVATAAVCTPPTGVVDYFHHVNRQLTMWNTLWICFCIIWRYMHMHVHLHVHVVCFCKLYSCIHVDVALTYLMIWSVQEQNTGRVRTSNSAYFVHGQNLPLLLKIDLILHDNMYASIYFCLLFIYVYMYVLYSMQLHVLCS